MDRNPFNDPYRIYKTVDAINQRHAEEMRTLRWRFLTPEYAVEAVDRIMACIDCKFGTHAR